MARGATKTAEQMSQNNVAAAQANQAQAAGRATQAYNTLFPQIQKMLSPGGDPAVMQAGMGALGSTYGNARQKAMDVAARTRNSAATPALLDELAQQQGQAEGQTAADTIAKQHQAGAGLLSSLYGQNEGELAPLLNASNSGVGEYNNAIKTGGGVLGKILQTAGMGLPFILGPKGSAGKAGRNGPPSD